MWIKIKIEDAPEGHIFSPTALNLDLAVKLEVSKNVGPYEHSDIFTHRIRLVVEETLEDMVAYPVYFGSLEECTDMWERIMTAHFNRERRFTISKLGSSEEEK